MPKPNPEAMNEQSSFFDELKQLVTEYFDARLKLVKLEAFEKIAKVTAAMFSSVIVALLAFFLLFFLSLSAGFYLGGIFNSNALGFLTVTGLYLILALLLLSKREFLETTIIERIVGELTRKEGQDEQSS
jgi:hypothetical protein